MELYYWLENNFNQKALTKMYVMNKGKGWELENDPSRI